MSRRLALPTTDLDRFAEVLAEVLAAWWRQTADRERPITSVPPDGRLRPSAEQAAHDRRRPAEPAAARPRSGSTAGAEGGAP